MFRNYTTPFSIALLFCVSVLLCGVGTPARGQESTDQPATTESPATESPEAQSSDADAETASSESPASDDSAGESDSSKSDTDPGQDDLDEAVVLRIDARSARELQSVERLLQSAIKKGLSGDNATFANKILGSVLLQKSQQMLAAMGQARSAGQRRQLFEETMRTLDEAIASDPGLVEAHLLVARLNSLPGGDKDEVIEATSKAIELLKDNPERRSGAYVLRALAWGPNEDDKRMADLDAAVKDNASNAEALTARAIVRLKKDDVSGAIEDMEQVLAKDPTNQQIAQVLVEKLTELDRVDDALELLSKALQSEPSDGLYRLRAIVYRMQFKEDEALADLNKALAIEPREPISLLQRAEISISKGNIQAAKDDLRAAEGIAPVVAASEQAIFVRCLIAIEEGRMADAINEMKTLIERDPSNDGRKLQLANLYIQDQRPRKAIEVLSNILDRDPTNIPVLRSRADAFLSVGDHDKAIDDYERAIKIAGEDANNSSLSAVLNNLAWVLATSPNDEIRDGKRAVELGERAVELTDEEQPHILSTLAAGYAEVGDFENAIRWSGKAVELGKEQGHEQIEQLEEELEQYKQGKPWREKQETEENSAPILSADDLIDT